MPTPLRWHTDAAKALRRKHVVPEKTLLAQVLGLAQRYSWRTYHTFDSRHSAAGFPDVIAIRGSRLLAIECKSSKGKPTREQQEWLLAFVAVSQVDAWVVRPADDLSDLEAQLR